MAQTKQFNLSWMRQYKANGNTYYGSGSPIRVGSTPEYHSYLGIPTQVRDALKTSRTSTSMRLKIYITDATSEWDVGRHKLSGASEPTATTMPWYNYLKAVHYSGTGWLTIDLTSDFMADYKNGVYQGLVLYGASNNLGVAENTGSNRAVIEVTGDWNDPPKAPTILYPVGGEVIDSSITFKWKNNGDPDGDTVSFQIAVKQGDGASWTYYNTAGTSYTIDTSKFVEGSRAQLAVRAVDPSGAYSSWVYSNLFSINHNKPPSPPTQLDPTNGSVQDRTNVIQLRWKHSSESTQAGFRIAWRTIDSNGIRGSWNYIPSGTSFINSTNQYYNIAPNTFPQGNIEWTVQTVNQQGLQSIYADSVIFKASNSTNAPIFLSPTDQAVINTDTVTVMWSSLNQQRYELTLMDAQGNPLSILAGNSSSKLLVVPYTLQNNTTYMLKLRILDTVNQLWSDYSYVTFYVQFSPPLPPVIKRTEEAGSGILNIFYSSADANILPDLIVGEGEKNSKVMNVDGTADTDYVLTGVDSVQFNGGGKGIYLSLTQEDIPLISGIQYQLNATIDVQNGGRLTLEAYDSNGELLNTVSFLGVTTMALPQGTAELRVRLNTLQDVQGAVNFTNIYLRMIPSTATEKIELYRRPYTEMGLEPWTKVASDLSLYGSFLDYTLASGVIYEYKAVAINETIGTNSESEPFQAQIFFEDTFLQESHNLANMITLQYATSKESEFEIENQLVTFAGRQDPVREYGEHETMTLTVDWEVDNYVDVLALRDMFRRRDILLYRDRNGRRLWVTSEGFSVKDKIVSGFEISAKFTVTSYNEEEVTTGGAG